MTTFRDGGTVICKICGMQYNSNILCSIYMNGSRDLDTRPPEMLRSMYDLDVNYCERCGYCASDISKAKRSTRKIVESDEYQMIFTQESIPDTARFYLCKAYIENIQKDYISAGWSFLRAAWVCDDHILWSLIPSALDGDILKDRAKKIRTDSITSFKKAKRKIFGKQKGADEVLLADLMRRSGVDVDEIIKVCNKGLKIVKDENIKKCLDYQKYLTASDDRDCHTYKDAFDYVKEYM